MSDLINRQDAIDLVEHRMKHNPMKSVQFIQGLQDAYLRVLSDLKALPPAEPERKRGKWIVVPDNIGDFQKAGYRWIKCNKCNNQVKIRLDSPLYDFCPYCGSNMRERREDVL